MKLKGDVLRDYLSSSLWFVPALFLLAAFALSEVAYAVDKAANWSGSSWFLFGGGTDSARAVVSTIATSMLTFTGLVFSVTMLVLQLASNQLSPRVMRTFLRDRANQLVLGTFIATFIYSLLVLRHITNVTNVEPFVPTLSVWIAVALVLLCTVVFIYYMDHIAKSIRPTTVMRRVAAETRRATETLYPEPIGDAIEIEPPQLEAVTAVVLAPRSGIVTDVDDERISKSAHEMRCVVEFQCRVGDFVREGQPICSVHGRWDGDAAGLVRRTVRVGTERTMRQDAAFGFRQLVDIAIRALSPGINDPTTAVQTIDYLHDLLARLATRSIPSPVRRIEGRVTAILPRPSWDDYVALVCDEIRRAGAEQIQVQRRLRDMLTDLRALARPQLRPPLNEQLAMLDAALETFEGFEMRRASTPSAQGHGTA